MRVTIGERLGIVRNTAYIHQRKPLPDEDEAIPEAIEPEYARPLRLADCPSSTLPYGTPVRRLDDGGPARVRGEMVWLKKDVSILRIEGRRDLNPEEFSENRRR